MERLNYSQALISYLHFRADSEDAPSCMIQVQNSCTFIWMANFLLLNLKPIILKSFYLKKIKGLLERQEYVNSKLPGFVRQLGSLNFNEADCFLPRYQTFCCVVQLAAACIPFTCGKKEEWHSKLIFKLQPKGG